MTTHCPGCCGWYDYDRPRGIRDVCPGVQCTACGDHERWLNEMLEDYRIPHDSHIKARRVALNSFIHGLRAVCQQKDAEIAKLTAERDEARNEAVRLLDENLRLKFDLDVAYRGLGTKH